MFIRGEVWNLETNAGGPRRQVTETTDSASRPDTQNLMQLQSGIWKPRTPKETHSQVDNMQRHEGVASPPIVVLLLFCWGSLCDLVLSKAQTCARRVSSLTSDVRLPI
mmetsp:Transcript_7803/g.18015  ORF Transcript_7803/g.18015 Transcript_7803/m.18015 type:complete len:108 (-) Transcript_7803:565-888(-)